MAVKTEFKKKERCKKKGKKRKNKKMKLQSKAKTKDKKAGRERNTPLFQKGKKKLSVRFQL